MDRRDFLKTTAIGLIAGITPIGALANVTPLSPNKASKHRFPSGKLTLTYQPYELRLNHPFTLARSSRTTTPDVQVQLHWEGLTGYGEASMPPYLGESTDSVCRYLESLDLEQFHDPFRVDDIHVYLDSVAPDNRAAKASVDIALHDLLGKAMGQPWHRIWGLNPEKAPHTSFTIGIDKPDVIRQKVTEAMPYSVLKVKMGLDNDKELVEIIREMRPDVPICVDANQGWTDRNRALEMCHWLAERGCLLVEQPMDREALDDTAWLREHSPLPIIADESVQRLADVRRLSGAFDGINIKLMKSTGMHEAYQMALLARALGMKMMIGCMTETSCAISAAAQLAPLADWADLDGNLLIANDPFDGAKVVEGRIIPDANRPGIGVLPK